MTYYGSKELAAAFRTVRNNTIKIAEEIPAEHYGFQPAAGTRTVAQTLVHIAVVPRVAEQVQFTERRSTLVGFDFFSFMGSLIAEEHTPRTKAEILSLLTEGRDRFARLLESSTEDFLAERVAYPEAMQLPSKSRFEMLLSQKEHEMHHRAQLMQIERLLGIVPHLTRDMEARIAAMQAARVAGA